MNPPQPDLDSAPFWAALREHRVIVQRCDSCSRDRFGRLGSCPHCGTLGGTDVEVPGDGTIYSFVRVHRALTPEMRDEVPYAIGTVELDSGARMVGRVEPAEEAAIGRRVVARFVDHDDWTELRFAVAP